MEVFDVKAADVRSARDQLGTIHIVMSGPITADGITERERSEALGFDLALDNPQFAVEPRITQVSRLAVDRPLFLNVNVTGLSPCHI